MHDGSVTLSLLSFLAVKKCIALILLTLLPLQLAWAAASVYCSHHEQGANAEHFGHHPDEHGALEITLDFPGPDDGTVTRRPARPHRSSRRNLRTAAVYPRQRIDTQRRRPEAHVSTQPPASPASLIERPNWRVLA